MIPILLAALPLLGAGAPPPFIPSALQAEGRSGPLRWEAPEPLVDFARPISNSAAAELARIERWLGLGPSPEGRVEWFDSRDSFAAALSDKAPDWYAAVTIPSQRRILMLADRSKASTALAETFRHELVHWAMSGVGEQAWASLPAWFHEGVAETWARTDPLSRYSSPLAWRAFRNELTPLARFRDGFGPEPVLAAEGYALGFAFVTRLTREYGDAVVARLLARVRAGDSLDQALVAVTGLSLVTHEERLRSELGSWSALLGQIYPQLFLFFALLILALAPLVWRARRRRRRAFEEKWEREDRAEEPPDEDDRWILPR